MIEEVLRRKGWLSSTQEEFQRKVLTRGDVLNLRTGESLFHAGDDAGGIFGLIDGRLELHLAARGESATLAHLAGAGFWVGDFAAIRGEPRRFSLVARRECILLRLTRAEMQRICQEDPASWRHLAELAAANLGLTLDFAEMLRRVDSVARVAAALAILSEEDAQGHHTVEASQADLAAMTRLSRGMVNAALHGLEQRGWIERRYGGVTVTSPSELAEFVRQN
jgi:CRP/FNR family transcriptional regulator, cyclic AMP receptor protein